MEWNVVCPSRDAERSPSVIRGFQYEEWNEMLSVRLSHTWFPIWGMKWNVVCPSQSYVVSNMRTEMKCCLSISVIRGVQYEDWNEMLSVHLSHTWCPIWGMKWNVVCPSQSYVVSNMRNEMKCLTVSVKRGFEYEEWNEMLSVRLSHTWCPIWGMKWNVCPSAIRGFE